MGRPRINSTTKEEIEEKEISPTHKRKLRVNALPKEEEKTKDKKLNEEMNQDWHALSDEKKLLKNEP